MNTLIILLFNDFNIKKIQFNIFKFNKVIGLSERVSRTWDLSLCFQPSLK